MRTYQSGTKDKKPNKKVLYGILLSVSVVALATIITLSLVFGGSKPPVDNTPPVDPDPPIVAPPVDPDPIAPIFVVPVTSYTIGKEASLTKVVYSSSMNYWRTHNGIDLIADENSAVYAVTDGTVTSVQHTVLEATVITIEHANGLVTIYKGLSTEVNVNVGDVVAAGAQIGKVGAVMPLERDDGPHLHLEMKLNTKLIDPAAYLPELSNK